MKKALTLLLLFVFVISFSQNEKTLQFVNVSNDIDTCQYTQVSIVANFIDYDSLKWQRYDYTNIYNLQNGLDYTGVNNDTLIINQASGIKYYRCIAYNQTDSIISDSIIVKGHVDNMSLPIFIKIATPCSAELIVDNAATSIWSTGDTTSTAIYVNPASNQYYYVNAVDEYGCTFFDSCLVAINEFNFSLNKDTVCLNKAFLAEGISSQYGWTAHFLYDNTFKMNSPVTYNSLNIGIDTVFFWVTGYGCTSNQIMKEIVTIENNGSITKSNDTLYSSNAVSYQWFFNDSILINETNNYITIDSIGLYEVELFNINGCTKKVFYYNDSINGYSVVAEPNEICAGDTSTLTTYIDHCLLIDFNDSTLSPYLTTPPLTGNSNDPGDHFLNPCIPSLDGSTYFWNFEAFYYTNDCMPSDLTTIPLDITSQDFICFDFMMPQQPNDGFCDAPDRKNEGVSLQYSTNFGNTWDDITYFCPDGYEYPSNIFTGIYNTILPIAETQFTQWDNYCYYFPPSSISSSTMIRWYQSPVEYATAYWFIDNIFICSIPLEDALQVEWYDDHLSLISDSNQTPVSPSQTTDYMNIVYNPPFAPETLYVSLVVNPLPNPVIIQTSNVLSIGTYPSYQWFYNGDTIPGANNYSYSTYNNGNYHVNVIDTNGCVGNSDTIFVSISSVDEVGNNNTIKIYPNPVKDILTIESSQELNNDIKITDLSGRVLITDKLKGKSIEINVSSLKKGIYLLQISETNEVIRFTKR